MKKIILAVVILILCSCVSPCYAYSKDKPTDVNSYVLKSSQISFYFPTEGSDPAPTLITLYNSANNTIDVAIYSLTNQKITDAISSASDRGIKVRVITDRMEAGDKYQKVALAVLKAHNIPIMINSHAGLMHLKMSIVDKTFVTLGSYNYSLSASQTNDEVMVVITEPMSIQTCQDEFDKMWDNEKAFEKYGGN